MSWLKAVPPVDIIAASESPRANIILGYGQSRLGGSKLRNTDAGPLTPSQQGRDRYKRPFDLIILLVAHVLLFPVLAVLWTAIPVAIWLGDGGPVFYTQLRVGKGGKLLTLIKFRTMVQDAEAQTGPIWAGVADRRITRVGRFLRRFRLDELPQVINMWRGEMSLVGPRPERPELVERFSRDIPGFSKRLRVRPGFAGLAQVRGRYSTRPGDKLRYDNLYIQTMSPWLDIKLLFLAVLVVLRRNSH